eukprot:10599155-Lingulodinium_polyedra.AAC.1
MGRMALAFILAWPSSAGGATAALPELTRGPTSCCRVPARQLSSARLARCPGRRRRPPPSRWWNP